MSLACGCKTLNFQQQKAWKNKLLQTKRSEMHFDTIWNDVEAHRERCGAAAAKLPRARRAPRRLDEGEEAAEYVNVTDYFRVQYFTVFGPGDYKHF